MATTTKKKTTATDAPVKMTAAEVRAAYAKLQEDHEKLKNGAYCYMCDRHRPRDKFYLNTDIRSQSGLSPICKDCAKDIALRKDEHGHYHEGTKESVQLALFYLNKPFIENAWTGAIQEVNAGTKENIWAGYIKNIQMINYVGLTYRESDMFREKILYEDEKTAEDVMRGRENQDTYSDFIKNKKDVVRLLGYDPFEKEVISDQPFLYSQLLGLLDASEDANDDMMRTASAISIVRGFLQLAKIDDEIVKITSNPSGLLKNSSAMKQLIESKKACTQMIKDLAAESCISLKNNKQAKKGENTWTGKMKKIKDLNLREAEINGFDVGTCRGMQQVADISMEAIIKKLNLDESEYSNMLAEQRVMVVKANNKADAFAEAARILLRENVDLRNLLKQNDLLDESELVDLHNVVNTYFDHDQKAGDE